MLRERYIPLADADAWREALRGLPHGFFHTWESCAAMHLSTGAATFLYSLESGIHRTVCPFFERTYGGHVDIATPYGFSGFVGDLAYGHVSNSWRSSASSRSYTCGFIQLHPVLQRGSEFPVEEVDAYNEVFVIDLTRSVQDLHDSLSTNRRRQLRGWEQLRGHLVHDREACTAFITSQYQQFYAARGASDAYRFSPATFQMLLGLDEVISVGFRTGSRLEAVSIFAQASTVGEFLFNISVPDGRRHSTPLIWFGIQALKARGATVLNLGGGIYRNDPLAEYKRRFGGETLPLRALKQIYDPDNYGTLCRRAGADPVERAGYFPPYRRSKSNRTFAGR